MDNRYFRSKIVQMVNLRKKDKQLTLLKKKHDFNSHELLKNWVVKETDFFLTPIEPSVIRKKLILLYKLSNSTSSHSKFNKSIRSVLNSSNITIHRKLQDLYIQSFFSFESYNKTISKLKENHQQYNLRKRVETLNYPHTLSFIIGLANDPRALNQIDRASTIVKAALDLYLKFTDGQFNIGTKNSKLCAVNYSHFFDPACTLDYVNITDKLNSLNRSSHIVVIIDGQAYKLELKNNNTYLSVDEIRTELDGIVQAHAADKMKYPPIGAFSTASCTTRFEARAKHLDSTTNKKSFAILEQAIFILCLDTEIYDSKKIMEQMYAHNFHNRYFTNTQFIVGKEGEAAIIASYVKIDGMPAIEISDHIYKKAVAISFSHNKKLSDNISLQKIPFIIDQQIISALSHETKQLLHDHTSTFILPVNVNFFKEMQLSPNITINFIIMLASSHISRNLPVTNQAISRKPVSQETVQLDWNFIHLEKIKKFQVACQECYDLNYDIIYVSSRVLLDKFADKKIGLITIFLEADWHYQFYITDTQMRIGTLSKKDVSKSIDNKQDILKNQLTLKQKAKLIEMILSAENLKPDLTHLYILLKDAVEYQQTMIELSQKGLSPTFFFSKPQGILFEKLIDFYLELGQNVPAYRNYLFRAHRNDKSVDILTSSLTLPESITSLGRPGTNSDMLQNFGLHILRKGKNFELVFIPNVAWSEKISDLITFINQWLLKITLIEQYSWSATIRSKHNISTMSK